MREPTIDTARPLAQVELWKERLVHGFQRRQDGTDFFGGVGSDARDLLQFIKASSELQPGRVRQIECFLASGIVSPRASRYQTQPQWMIILQPPLVCHFGCRNMRCSSERSCASSTMRNSV